MVDANAKDIADTLVPARVRVTKNALGQQKRRRAMSVPLVCLVVHSPLARELSESACDSFDFF